MVCVVATERRKQDLEDVQYSFAMIISLTDALVPITLILDVFNH
jgi:hypothetical protein